MPLFAVPPYVRKATLAEIKAYYRAIAQSAQCPVWVQNHIPPIGTTISPEFLANLVADIEWVDHIKGMLA
ncbi:MAG TPA: dihydrodipicolinate synthase family protein [bacterium]|nr:dihydrodipicolinate synthase family protein [bacterium]